MSDYDLSVSQVQTIQNCEQAWAFRYLVKLPEKKSEALEFGLWWDEVVNSLWSVPVPFIFNPYQKQCVDAYLKHYETVKETLLVSVQPERIVEFAEVKVIAKPDLIFDDLIVDNKTIKNTPKSIEDNHRLQLIVYSKAFGIRHCRIDYLVKLKTPKIVPIEYLVSDEDYIWAENIFREAFKKKMRIKLGGKAQPNPESPYCYRSSCSYWRECEFLNDLIIRTPKSGVEL